MFYWGASPDRKTQEVPVWAHIFVASKIDPLRILGGPEPWPTSVWLPNCGVTLLLETQSGVAAPDKAAEIQGWVHWSRRWGDVCSQRWRWQHLHADLRIKYLRKVRGLTFQRLSWRKIWSLGESIYFHLDPFSSRPWYPIVVSVLQPVDCSEENFGIFHQTSSIILSLTPVHCGHVDVPLF